MYKRELQKAAAEQSKGEWRLKEGKGLEPEPWARRSSCPVDLCPHMAHLDPSS